MYFPLKMWIIHCYLSLPEGNDIRICQRIRFFIDLEFCFPGRTAKEPYAWMVYALAAFLDDVPLKPTKTLKSGMGNWITQAS